MTDRPLFYFDVASPYAYLASTRVEELIGEVDWQPVLAGALHKHYRRASWGATPALREAGVAEIQRRALAYGLPDFAWPQPYPANTLTAMRAAVFAQQHGRARDFAHAAFALAFVEGVDLTLPASVLLAGERAGLEVSELGRALGDPSLKQALRDANDLAIGRGVYGVPTVEAQGRLWWGDDQLAAAANAGANTAVSTISLASGAGPSAPSRGNPVRGGCLCDGVRYEVTSPFRRANYCHCSRCRKHSGAASLAQGRVARAGFHLISGEDLLRTYRPDAGKAKTFCSRCGASLFGGTWPGGPEVSVRLGTLDDDPVIRPEYHAFCDSAPPWDQASDDGLPRYPGPAPGSDGAAR